MDKAVFFSLVLKFVLVAVTHPVRNRKILKISILQNRLNEKADSKLTVDGDFGFGGGVPRGNVIGNDFNSNNIGEYFYDNIISDNFSGNIIGDDFTLGLGLSYKVK